MNFNTRKGIVMKKVLSVLLMAVAIHVSCFAEGAARSLSAEEKTADQLVAALPGNTVTYEQVTPSFHPDLLKNVPAAGFADLKKNIKEKIGNIKDVNIVSYFKRYNPKSGYANINDLVYVGTAGKDKYARIVVTFAQENGSSKIVEFLVTPLEQPKEEKENKK